MGDDAVWGTNANDYFTAKPGVLSDDTYIDGLGGTDTLYADIKVNDDTISPEIRNVETVLFRAQKVDDGASVGNLTNAEIDAEHISGMKVLGSENSRDTLKVEDVRIDSTDLTVRFGSSDPGKVGFEVYFDQQHLKAEKSQTSGTLTAKLIDTVGALPTTEPGGHDNPLWDNPFTAMSFTLNGKEYTLNFGEYNHTTTGTDLPSYEGLVKQMQAAIDADPALSGLGLKVSTGNPFDAVVSIGPNSGQTVTGGVEILVNTDQGKLEGNNWIAAKGLPATNSTAATFVATSDTTCPLIQTNVELDNVGRVQWDDASPCLPDNSVYGSQAGDLVIGGNAGRGGVERFDVTVDQGSWLSSMSSTNNALRMVTVKNGAIYGDNDNGNLFIGDPLPDPDQTSTEISYWMDAPRLLDTTGLTDVKYFDASAMTGKVNIGAQLTAAAYDKYLKDVDGVDSMAQGYAPNGPFKYLLGSNDDTLNMTVNGGVAADTDFRMNIDAGAGNDLVNFSFPVFDGNQLADQMKLKNVSVNLGAGDDTFHFWGNGAMDVSDGAGNDALYVGQDMSSTPAHSAADYNAVWVFNVEKANDAKQTGIFIGGHGAQPLENDLLGGATSFNYGPATGGEKSVLKAEVNFKGIKATATLDLKSEGGQLSHTDINHLLIKAINEDATLSKLLLAKDGAGSSLMVEALYNGEMQTTDLKFTFTTEKLGGGATSITVPTGLPDAYDMTAGTHAAFASNGAAGAGGATISFTGSNTGTDSATTIHMGLGNDVIALNANKAPTDAYFDTLVLNGAFGDDVVMNFTTGDDKIDATAGKYENAAGGTPHTFAALDAKNIKADDPYYGLFDGGTAPAIDGAGKTLLVVENTATAGVKDYWFFEVTSTDATLDEKDTITLLGTITTGTDTIVVGDIDIA